jgi:hypothetical protein
LPALSLFRMNEPGMQSSIYRLLCTEIPSRRPGKGTSALVVDATRMGKPVLDLIRLRAWRGDWCPW